MRNFIAYFVGVLYNVSPMTDSQTALLLLVSALLVNSAPHVSAAEKAEARKLAGGDWDVDVGKDLLAKMREVVGA